MRARRAYSAVRSASVAFMGAAWLCGCTTLPAAVTQTGDPATAFAPGATFRITPVGDQPSPALQARLEQHLRSLGLIDAGAGTPNLLLDVGVSERPIDVGAYAGLAPPVRPAPAGAWLAEPRKRHWWTPREARVCVVDVRASEPAAGRELYRLQVQERRRRGGCTAATDALLDRAIANLPPRPPLAQGR